MSSVLPIVGAIIGILWKVVEPVTQSVPHHVGFLFKYKKNLKKMDAEKKNLEKQIGEIQGKVEAANHLGEDIEKHVSNWLIDAEKMIQEVLEFIKNETAKENMHCCRFSCPDYIWRYRLTKQADKKAANLKNHTEKGGKFDAVSHPKPPPEELQLPSRGDYLNFQSREMAFIRIMEALKHSEVKMIGVYGPGGVGKTTMVEKVSKQAKTEGVFDEVVMAVVSQKANVREIQGQLADRLNVQLSGETEWGRAGQIWNRLNNGKKNLVILDDIWQELNLEEIGIPITDGNKNCKVVLTSRNRDVWKNMQVVHKREYPIKILLEEEAWTLFKKKVGDSVDSDHELCSVAVEVCKECKGLPVAINALGASLKGKKKYAWDDALTQLKSSMIENIEGSNPKQMYASLRLSYDLLESADAKSCFLLCCLFPEDANIPMEDLAMYCMARRLLNPNPDTLENARRRVLNVIDTLKICCLLLEGDDETCVKMHDVIRDVAISIKKEALLVKHGVQERPPAYDGYLAITLSFEKDINYELPDEVDCPQLHTLTLESRYYGFRLVKVPYKFFSRMEKLTVLKLTRMDLLPIPSSLTNLVNLRMLGLYRCKLGDIAMLKHLKNNLEIIILWGSYIETIPPEMGQLTRLRLLDLRYCYPLKVIPPDVLSNLTHLEELYMSQSLDQWEGINASNERNSASLFELRSLNQLTHLSIHIPNVVRLPKDLCFEKLIWFHISVGERIKYTQEITSSTRILKLSGITLEDDQFDVLLDRAEVICLKNVQAVKKLFHNSTRGGAAGEGFLNLKYLTVENCDDLEFIFSPFCATGLLKLQQLTIKDCLVIEKIVGMEGEIDEEPVTTIVNFGQLKYLELVNLPNLKSFYPKMKKMATTEGISSPGTQPLFNEKVAFPVLDKLAISNVPNLTDIWDEKLPSAESFCQLRNVSVQTCCNLVNLFLSSMLPQIQNVESISVKDCPKMLAIVTKKRKEEGSDDIILFPQLRTLNLECLQTLESFCTSKCTSKSTAQPFFNHQVAFPVLDKLAISNVPNLTDMWDEKLLSTESFCQLRNVSVQTCYNLVNLFLSSMLPQIQNVEAISVKDCPKMVAIISKKIKEESGDDIILFPQLRTLNLECLKNLKSFCTSKSTAQPFFNHQVVLPKLMNLSLVNCVNSGEVHLWHISSTVVSPFLLQRFQNLRNLKVRNCGGVRELFHFDEDLNVGAFGPHVGLFTEVEVMVLENLPQLTGLWNKNPNGILGLQKLKRLVIGNCPLLRSLFTSVVAMALEELYLISCTMIEEVIVATNEGDKAQVIDDIAFPKLEVLRLINMTNLKSFCSGNYNFNLPSLSRVHLIRCPNMQTFTPGIIRMPRISIHTCMDGSGIQIEDLNNYLQLLEGKHNNDSDKGQREEDFNKLIEDLIISFR